MSFNTSHLLILLLLVTFPLPSMAESDEKAKYRIAIVSSYHAEYIWSQQTNEGVVKALRDFGYLDNAEQGETYSKNYAIESNRAVVKKWWMDTKRKNSRPEIAATLARVTSDIARFSPDIILLSDDNAANYMGNHYLDSETPVVFWGVNGLPLKYGLLDSVENPGHNITGIYQAGYYFDSVRSLKKLFPSIQTIAVLSDDSPTGRSHAKKIKRYADEGRLEVHIVKVVITNSFSHWKREALALQKLVDAFYISTHHTLKDDQGRNVSNLDVAAWYLENIRKPEIAPSSFIVKEGLLSTVDDSAFKQGYEAVRVAHLILSGVKKAGEIASYAPERGAFIVNRWRARMLGVEEIIEQHSDLIDQVIDESAAWKHRETE